MIMYALTCQIQLEYYRLDANGVSAMHYAACEDNVAFLVVAQKLKLNFSTLSSNGSTPYHSAAVCGSELFYYLWSEHDGNQLPITVRERYQNLAHYTVMSSLKSDRSYLEKEREGKAACILHQLSKENQNMLAAKDDQNRNVFHYALKHGHFLCVNILLENLVIDGYKMLFQVDINNSTPFDYLFASLSNTSKKNVFNIPNNCVVSDIFKSKECKEMSNDDLEWIMSPLEMSLYNMLTRINIAYLQRFFSIYFKKINNAHKDIFCTSRSVTLRIV